MVREKKHWPVLQMDPAMKEFDEAWQKETRETLSELGLRISLFLEFLVGRSETNVVVVTHGVWLE
jgi:broad specificity phosphatase PhoE